MIESQSQSKSSNFSMYAVIFIAYFFVNFHRYAGGVSAPILVEELSLTPTQVGLFGAVFTYCYAFMNLPAGMLIDKFGSRKAIGTLYILAAFGTLVVAISESFSLILVGRALIAMGIAPVYAAASKTIAVWEKPEKFSIYNGFLMSFGRAGGVIAATPLVLLIGAMGWRNTYIIIAIISVVIAIGAFLLVKENKDVDEVNKSQGNKNPFKGFRNLVTKPQYWLVLIFMISLNGTTVNIFANWGGVFLSQGLKFSNEISSNILLMGSIAAVTGAVISGYISSKKSARFAGFIGQTILLIAVGILAFFTESLSTPICYITFIAIGLVEMYVIAAGFSLIRTLATSKYVGTAFGTGNLIVWIAGSSLISQLWGILIPGDFALSGFSTALKFHFILVLVGLVCLYFIKEEPIKELVE
ncbi:MAG: MFS transporter [Eubacteriales bacterium]